MVNQCTTPHLPLFKNIDSVVVDKNCKSHHFSHSFRWCISPPSSPTLSSFAFWFEGFCWTEPWRASPTCSILRYLQTESLNDFEGDKCKNINSTLVFLHFLFSFVCRLRWRVWSRCCDRRPLRFSLPWVWALAPLLPIPLITPGIITATVMHSRSLSSTSSHLCWPLWWSLLCWASVPKEKSWTVCPGRWSMLSYLDLQVVIVLLVEKPEDWKLNIVVLLWKWHNETSEHYPDSWSRLICTI